jgi:hypothetical protein
VTRSEARAEYARHADDPRRGDEVALCILVVVVAAVPLGLIFAIRALLGLGGS